MSFQKTLAEKRRSPVAVFHEFRLKSAVEKTLHVFVEGYADLCYYSRVIEEHIKTSDWGWRSYVSFGKKNIDVISQYLADSGLSTDNVIMVRDSDVDLFLNNLPKHKFVFLTEGYSVENYVCSEAALSDFIQRVFGISEDEVDQVDLASKFSDAVRTLFEWLRPLFAAGFAAISRGEKFDFDQFDVDVPFQELMEGKELAPITELPASTSLRLETICELSSDMGVRYCSQDHMLWLRGKYILNCASRYLRNHYALLRQIYADGEISRFNRRASADFSPGAIFERLCGHAKLSHALGAKVAGIVGVA